MSDTLKVHEAGDVKVIEIHSRLFYFNKEIADNLEDVPQFISVYNDSGTVIGAAFLELDKDGVNAVLTFDYHSPERFSIELNDGYKYYAHPQFVENYKKLLFILINNKKPEDSRIQFLKI